MALQALKTQLHARHADMKENLALLFSEKEGPLSWENKLIVSLATSYASTSHELTSFLEELCTHDLELDDCGDIKALIPMLELKISYNDSVSLIEDDIFPSKTTIVKTSLENPCVSKTTFALIYLTVSLLNHSKTCVDKAQAEFLKAGGTKEEIVEAVKVISVINGVSKAFELESKGPIIS